MCSIYYVVQFLSKSATCHTPEKKPQLLRGVIFLRFEAAIFLYIMLMKKIMIVFGILILFIAEILRVYFIMPFPGSQNADTINIAWFLHKNILYIRLAALLLIAFALFRNFPQWKKWKKFVFIFFMLMYSVVFYMVNYKFLADKMFYQPTNKNMFDSNANKVSLEKLVVGVVINNEARAYPVEIIGYHHQVQDTVGSQPVMVTYCTVCRTGRVFSPFVDGKKENFRLVGMDHFNAMFEDNTTKSWWRQVTGEAITGPLKGKILEEIPSQQMTLAAWLRAYPYSLILQPDSLFKKEYDDLAGFDKGTIESGLEKRDSSSWQLKSWIVGVQENGFAKAYDWNELISKKIIHDSLPGLPLVIFVEPDSASFHVWNRQVNNLTLSFVIDSSGMKDLNTQSLWNFDGRCTEGELKGGKLKPVQGSQEFWHSWKTFYPNTIIYKGK